MASINEPKTKRAPTEEEMLQAFRMSPQDPPVESARGHVPAIMQAIEPLAASLSVRWPAVLLAVLVATAALSPEDTLEIAPSVKVRSVIWVLMLHPGATNSSGVTGCIADALQRICARDFDEAKVKADRELQRAAAAAAEPDTQQGAPETKEPPRRQIIAGGGSLAGTGLEMSQEKNRGAALVVEPEVDHVIQWFTNEVSVDSSAPGKLWDGRAWHRAVLDKARAFTILNPWLSILCAGHVPEVFKATVKDAFGLRQRLTVCFPFPTFDNIRKVREVCMSLPVSSHTPEDYLAGLLYPVFKNSLARKGICLKPSSDDGADKEVDKKFDTHVELQKESFLKPHQHEQSKKHGKLRTKFDRLLIAMHLLNTYCLALQAARTQVGDTFDILETPWGADSTPAATVPKNVVDMTYLMCTYFENVWETLDFARKSYKLPKEDAGQDATQAGPPDLLEQERSRLELVLTVLAGKPWKDDDLDFFLEVSASGLLCALRSDAYKQAGLTSETLLAVMQYLVTGQLPWFRYESSSAVSRALWRIMQRTMNSDHKKLIMYCACLAAKLLTLLGVGALVRTVKVAGGGNPNWWYVPKPATRCMHELLDLLGVHDASTPSLEAYTEWSRQPLEKPTRAPEEILWVDVNERDQKQVLEFLGLSEETEGEDEGEREGEREAEVEGDDEATQPGEVNSEQRELQEAAHVNGLERLEDELGDDDEGRGVERDAAEDEVPPEGAVAAGGGEGSDVEDQDAENMSLASDGSDGDGIPYAYFG